MKEERLLIAGFGGQGVMMLGKLLALAGMYEERQVSWFPSYGPEMRGGTANCHVILSDQAIGSPIVTEATCVIAMNRPSFEKFRPLIEPGGMLLFDSSLISLSLQDAGDDSPPLVRIPVPTNEIAKSHGSGKAANMVMLGVYLALTKSLCRTTVEQTIYEMLGAKKALLGSNLAAFNEGYRLFINSIEREVPV